MRALALASLAALIVASCRGEDPAAMARKDRALEAIAAGGIAPGAPSAVTSDTPALDEIYWRARGQLLALGYRPAKAAPTPWRICADEMLNPDDLGCEPDTDLPEIAGCSGTGMAFCLAYWIAPDGRALKITTAGEPQPYRIHQVGWAAPADIEQLPAGWKR